VARTGRRLVFTGASAPLELREVEVPDPEPGGIVVRTVVGGVCGTDAHRLDGDLPDPPSPVAFGHEGIGRIELLGPGVTTDRAGAPVTVGDLVYWGPSGLQPAAPPATGWPPPADVPSAASYQDHATLGPTNLFYRIPEDVAPDAVIAFGCAMPTALGGLARLGGITAGERVVVQGCGPVGLAATALASLAGAGQVIVLGAPDARLAAAARLGATATVPLDATTEAERRDAVLDLTDGRGADVVVEATGRMAAFAQGMDLLADAGRYLVLGIYSGHGTVPLDVVRLNNRSQRVIGSMGPAALDDYRTTIELAARHGARLGFADLITHRFPLSRTAEAIATVRRGEAIKAVVLPDLDA
jgi:5-exo-hydroxycamphor dehydrogenase